MSEKDGYFLPAPAEQEKKEETDNNGRSRRSFQFGRNKQACHGPQSADHGRSYQQLCEILVE